MKSGLRTVYSTLEILIDEKLIKYLFSKLKQTQNFVLRTCSVNCIISSKRMLRHSLVTLEDNNKCLSSLLQATLRRVWNYNSLICLTFFEKWVCLSKFPLLKIVGAPWKEGEIRLGVDKIVLKFDGSFHPQALR